MPRTVRAYTRWCDAALLLLLPLLPPAPYPPPEPVSTGSMVNDRMVRRKLRTCKQMPLSCQKYTYRQRLAMVGHHSVCLAYPDLRCWRCPLCGPTPCPAHRPHVRLAEVAEVVLPHEQRRRTPHGIYI